LRTLGSWYLALELQAPGGGPSESTSSNVLNLVANATPISRGVILILALFSIASLAIILYKAWVFRRSARQSSSFLDVFQNGYQAIVGVSHRPILIAETASVEDPTNPQAKPQWITPGSLQTLPTSFPRIRVVMYFDSTGNGFGTYPFDSSPASLAAMQSVAEAPLYQSVAPPTSWLYP